MLSVKLPLKICVALLPLASAQYTVYSYPEVASIPLLSKCRLMPYFVSPVEVTMEVATVSVEKTKLGFEIMRLSEMCPVVFLTEPQSVPPQKPPVAYR